MNKFLIITQALFLSSQIAFSQETAKGEIVIKKARYEYGGYGAPVGKITRINNSDGVIAGAKAAWLIDHSIGLGGAAYGLVNNVTFANFKDPLEFVYGGPSFEYIYQVDDKVSFTGGALLGAGLYDFNDNIAGNDGVYVAEPEISALYEITKNFKGALTFGYRFVTDVDLTTVSNSKLSGFSYGVSFNLGIF
ncbi:MAG: hypothetical protein HOE90_02815 [Bacteriovoracaceae bacterium]|jgi:hypothetical protein|nr:hypothetical protein [Bacteriovoracaceae bacterium]